MLAAAWDLAKAVSKYLSIPMTSPVERISGPSSESTTLPSGVRKRAKGSTASFTETGAPSGRLAPSPVSGSILWTERRWAIDTPTPIIAAALASCTPVALEVNGTVREARGFASIT